MLNSLKVAIFTVTVLICLLLGYMLLSFTGDYEAHLALDAFLKGDYNQSEAIIERLRQQLPEEQYHLDLAYIERAKQQLAASDQQLQEAFHAAHGNPLTLEIALNQAYNAYLAHNHEALQTALRQATELAGPDHEWVLFLSSLTHAGPMEKAPPYPVALSAWMKKAFDSTFTPFWYALHQARLEIESGQSLTARQHLELLGLQAGESYAQEIQFLTGWSYLKRLKALHPWPRRLTTSWRLATSGACLSKTNAIEKIAKRSSAASTNSSKLFWRRVPYKMCHFMPCFRLFKRDS